MDPVAKKKLKKTFSKRDFTACINIFKKYFDESTLDSNSAFIVGISYLYKFEFEKAEKYLKLSVRLDNANVNAILGLAALNLKQKKLEKSIENYLQVIEIDENNKLAQKILNKLKKTENIDKLIRKMRFKDYIPLPYPKVTILSFITLSLIIIVTILLIIFIVYNWL